MAKVLYLPLNCPQTIQTGMYDAFRDLGVELSIFDFYPPFLKRKSVQSIRGEFLQEVRRFKPDLIHMQLQFTGVIDGNTLLEAKKIHPKAILTNWTGDIRSNVPGEFAGHSRAIDIALISSVGQLDLYRKAVHCGDVRYWQIGYNPKLYFPQNKTTFCHDISFVASKYNTRGAYGIFPGAEARTNAANHLLKGPWRFGLFGNGWGKRVKAISQKTANDVYGSSFSCLNISNFNDVYLYFSDRMLMCLASGRPVISYNFPGWEAYFTDMKDIVMVNSPQGIDEKLKWLKANPQKANEIGRAGAELAQKEHTYFCRAAELLRMVGLR